MLIFLHHKIAFLATPKTGTTAVEMALRPQAEIIFTRNRKHTTAARYANKVAPFLEDTFGVRPDSVAVMRDPVDQIRSWYKYRTQERMAGTDVSTIGITFDQFVREVIEDAPKRAQIGRQFSFLTSGAGDVLVDHLFAYERQEVFLEFMGQRLGQAVEFKPQNVSPQMDAPLAPATLAALREARAEDFALHESLLAQGGYLQNA